VEEFAKYVCVQDGITLLKNNLNLEFKVWYFFALS
jgi:hypothetical protein